MELLIFYPLALISLVLALLVVFNKSPIGSAMCLIGMMLGLAGVFVLMQAHFLAILQVIIYAGAIMVLFMFAIMLLNLKGDDKTWKARDRNLLLSSLTGVLLVGVLYKFIDITAGAEFNSPVPVPDSFGTTEQVGTALFTDFVLPFEVASILLLAAMVGAVVLAKSKVD
ncbi:MAG: NADH-quinone oxidoreductase subunit J [Nitrospinaceae bacterium]|nr:NADH-quinone oxidoreductase subunit J [Nitrospinaceae bacterium]NIR56299.1 NADH-quinone oxidoreductase subunit J [Nitrospinaceae bacterium]NIS86756.1 NADH-quinone oxidoreductase subunit J [Nitrospinaceae bacterium]NIT83591.1 NADH-quinone oxidoreductase subunit J [Nitrospinaceae bacterium]NIU45793.1 NADH-quinone oxidoreductase subunit J [Nitrospinaceae bacterium]